MCQSDVYFPTDYNLLWDSSRNCLDTVKHLLNLDPSFGGLRKIKDWRSRLKSGMLGFFRACASKGKGKEDRVDTGVDVYLTLARELSVKVESFVVNNTFDYLKSESVIRNLCYFLEMLNKHINLLKSKLVFKENIPASEKIYSIFETYTEWITRGKMLPDLELGKRINIVSDQYHLILHWKISDHQSDVDMLIPLMDRVIWKH